MSIELEFDSLLAEKWLRGLSKKWDDVAKRQDAYVKAIGVFVFQDVMDHFRQERGSADHWAPWSNSYQTKMELDGKGGNKILQDTGRLRNSFKAGMWRKTPAGIEWYNDAKTSSGFPYAYAHNEGGPKLPKRDFMWLSESAMDKISEATLAFITGDE